MPGCLGWAQSCDPASASQSEAAICHLGLQTYATMPDWWSFLKKENLVTEDQGKDCLLSEAGRESGTNPSKHLQGDCGLTSVLVLDAWPPEPREKFLLF